MNRMKKESRNVERERREREREREREDIQTAQTNAPTIN